MPAEVAHTLLLKVRDFAMAVTEPQQAADALLLVAMATRRLVDPATAMLLKPLMQMVEEGARSLVGVHPSGRCVAQVEAFVRVEAGIAHP